MINFHEIYQTLDKQHGEGVDIAGPYNNLRNFLSMLPVIWAAGVVGPCAEYTLRPPAISDCV